MPYSAPYVTDNFREPTGTIGWVTVEPSLNERRPVYSEPGGDVIGSSYRNLGFVPLDDVDAFDPAAARRGNYGCDPLIDAGCAPGTNNPER